MNEKVQVVNQKIAELQQALKDVLGTEADLRFHGWIGHFGSQSKLAISLMEKLDERGIEYTDTDSTIGTDYKELRVVFGEGSFNLSMTYQTDLESKKRALEIQLAAIEQEIINKELTTTL